MNNGTNQNNINNSVVTNTNVTPIPMQAQPTQNVTPTPMPAQPGQTVTPTPMPAQGVVNPNPTNLNTNPVNPNTTPTVVPPNIPPSSANQEVTVINTNKSKSSNLILYILLILMVLFVLNIDTIIKYYDNYVNTGSLKGNTTENNTDNLVEGYVLINDSTGSIKLDSINFYNFRKSGDINLTFNYVSSLDYNNVSILDMYVEIYNSNKELLYKELFNLNNGIEKDSVRVYTIALDNYVYTNAYYALIKKYTEEEKNTKSSITCTLDNDDALYKIVYNFENNGLVNYSVNKDLKSDNDAYKTELDNEYNSVSNYFTATYENNNLNYIVDLKNYNKEFNPLYELGTVSKVIEVKEELKKWNCE